MNTGEEQNTFSEDDKVVVSAKSKQPSKMRYVVLLTAIWILIPAYYCFDQPVALFPALQQHMGDRGNFEYTFAALYIIYALGNAILPIFTGGMRDCNGDKPILTAITIIMILGQVLFTVGVDQRSIILQIFGRLLLGWGVESLLPLIAVYLAPYFKENVSLILGLLQFLCQIGLILSIYLTPQVEESQGLNGALLSGVLFLLFGFILLLISFYVDNYVEGMKNIGSFRQGNTSEIILIEDQDFRMTKFYWFKFKDFRMFPYMFWLLLAFNSILYCSIVTLVNVSLYVIASLLFKTDNQFKLIDISLFWMFGCTSLFLISFVVQYFRQRRYMIIGSVIIIMTGHLYYMTDPHIGLVILAVGFCLAFVSTWSAIIHMINLQAFGKAFGIIVCFQNIVFVFMPFLLNAAKKSYFGTTRMLLGFSIIALIIGILIIDEDIRNCGMLDKKVHIIRTHNFDNKNVSFDENAPLLQDNFASIIKHNS